VKQNKQQPTGQTISKGFWIKLGLVPVGMFAFAFALVPLYDTFCDLTGLNGRNSNTQYQGELVTGDYKIIDSAIDNTRLVSLNFLSTTSPGFPIKFYPKQKEINVVPGKIYTIKYVVENNSDETIIGQAIPSFAPGIAAKHFKKLQCFCFNNQEFKAHEKVEMSVRFFIDSTLDKNVHDITLSYNFFKVKQAPNNTNDKPLASLGGF
jgi:cytochrome c oxidase assembly protein subunit 11